MKRFGTPLTIATVVFAVAWFLPVIEGGTTLAKGGLPGWQAFHFALSPLWDASARESWWRATLSVFSALTNFWFVTSLVAHSGKLAVPRRALSWGSATALALNAHWFFVADPRSDLLAGYYCWFAAFAALALVTLRTPARSE